MLRQYIKVPTSAPTTAYVPSTKSNPGAYVERKMRTQLGKIEKENTMNNHLHNNRYIQF